MKDLIKWLNDALDSKDLVQNMTYYSITGNMIKATDGRITAAHPWPYKGEFLVPGKEFEKVLDRMPDTPTIEITDTHVRLRSGRYRGTIQTLPLNAWDYPGVDASEWRPLPEGLLDALADLRPFVSDNAKHTWSLSIALENGWSYATNNIAIACVECPQLGNIEALLPVWAVDFVLKRTEGLVEWAWSDSYVAFRWSNGAWMRSQLIVGKFPERAASLVRESQLEIPSQAISPEFREAFKPLAELAEDTIAIYNNRIESTFGKAQLVSDIDCEVPTDATCSVWGARFLLPVILTADRWSPSTWPRPTPFRGKKVSGYVVGRRM